MRGIAVAAACWMAIGTAAWAQGPEEEASIEALIEALSSDDFRAREEATAELSRLGEAAREALARAAASSDPEVATRATSLLAAIHRGDSVRQALGAGRPITLSLSGVALAEAAAAIEAASGVPIEVAGSRADSPVTLEADGKALLAVLDDLCRRAKDLRWSFRTGGGIRIEDGRFVDAPAAYAGPLRLRVVRVETAIANDFADRTTSADLTLAIDGERGPIEVDGVRVVAASDERGESVPWEEARAGEGRATSRMTINGRTIEVFEDGGELRIVQRVQDEPGRVRVSFSRLPGSPDRIEDLSIEARLRVPEGSERIDFERPKAGGSADAGEVGARVLAADATSVVLLLTGPEGRDPESLAPSSVSIESGGETIEVHPFDPNAARVHVLRNFRDLRREVLGREAKGRLVVVPLPEGKAVDRLRIEVARTISHRVEFRIGSVPLR